MSFNTFVKHNILQHIRLYKMDVKIVLVFMQHPLYGVCIKSKKNKNALIFIYINFIKLTNCELLLFLFYKRTKYLKNSNIYYFSKNFLNFI